jgi:hypothetical protein
MFTKDIDANVDVLKEILEQAPPNARMRARHAALQIEKVVKKLAAEGGRDPAIALGITLAVHFVAQHMIEQAGQGEGGLIQLLS